MISADMISLTPAGKSWLKWDGRCWYINQRWEAHICTSSYEFHLVINPLFISDGGTIPDALQNIISPLGKYLLAFIIHDALYGIQLCTRAEADWILLDLLDYLGASWWVRNQVWLVIKIGGSFAWNNKSKKLIEHNRKLIEFEAVKGFESLK